VPVPRNIKMDGSESVPVQRPGSAELCDVSMRATIHSRKTARAVRPLMGRALSTALQLCFGNLTIEIRTQEPARAR
jgi:hypothetical protein